MAVSTRRPAYRLMLEKLREARLERGLFQKETAEQMGRDPSFVSKVETGERRIDPIDLLCFAVIYDRDVRDFLPDRSSVIEQERSWKHPRSRSPDRGP